MAWQKELGLDKLVHQSQYPAVMIGSQMSLGLGDSIKDFSPIDGREIGNFKAASTSQVNDAIQAASVVFPQWRMIPAPKRGQLVLKIAEIVRAKKTALAELISVEVGKIHQEALGEVQEWIDVCDFAVGLSRQLYGLTIASERPSHRMMEQWLPLGNVGVISAFNFPVAVWAWNAMLAFVCGDPVIWKASEKAPLCAFACQNIVVEALNSFEEFDSVKEGLSSVVQGAVETGEALTKSELVPLISATGSIPMGKKVASVVGARLGRSLLELGGNNAMILTESANMAMAIRAVVFSAVGTTGQRCTTLRRLIVHRSKSVEVIEQLKKMYSQISIGDPLDENNLLGPLIDEAAYTAMSVALDAAQDQGGIVICGGERVTSNVPGGVYVQPAVVKMSRQSAVMITETFAPILYVIEYDEFEEAIRIHNEVPQGLSSAIFTQLGQQAERFISPAGSDCGIANVNIGTSGAEIGGAFGGEKETGGGRESGSDAWKNYMRRATNTINYGDELPLSQGIKFDLDSSI